MYLPCYDPTGISGLKSLTTQHQFVPCLRKYDFETYKGFLWKKNGPNLLDFGGKKNILKLPAFYNRFEHVARI